MTLHNLALPVWGERYVRVLLEAGLPSQIGALEGWSGDGLYEFYTTPADAEKIKAHPSFKALDNIMEVQFVGIVPDESSKWATLRRCHQQQVRETCALNNAATWFLCPDQIWSQGSLTFAANKIEEGYSAVMCAGPRSVEEWLIPNLRARFLKRSDGAELHIPSHDLVHHALIDYPHPETQTWYWDSDNYFQYPTYIYFKVRGQGVTAYCYIMHPIVVKPDMPDAPFHHIFDQDWLFGAVPDYSRIYVCRDSREICQIEVSPGDMQLPSQPSNPHRDPISALVWYYSAVANDHHRQFALDPVRFYAHGEDETKWQEAEERGRLIVLSVDHLLTMSNYDLLWIDPEALVRRIGSSCRFRSMSVEEGEVMRLAEDLRALRKHREPWVQPAKIIGE